MLACHSQEKERIDEDLLLLEQLQREDDTLRAFRWGGVRDVRNMTAFIGKVRGSLHACMGVISR